MGDFQSKPKLRIVIVEEPTKDSPLSGDLSGFWKTVVDTIQDGVMLVNPEGLIVSANRAMLEMSGYSEEELVGQNCSFLSCTNCRIGQRAIAGQDGNSEHWCQLFRDGFFNRHRCNLTTRMGEKVHILKNASVLRDSKGNTIGAVETMTDISELLEKEFRIEEFKKELDKRDVFHGMIGQSPPMQKLFSLVESTAGSGAPVVIYGESGTGKELVAYAIHQLSSRHNKPYIKVNCAALNENLLESELFGHVRGAFTNAIHNRKGRFEAAEKGSIFLDEIGDMPLSTQIKLLRVLEEKEIERVGDNRSLRFDVRVITATNRDLRSMVGSHEFREDFFYRINVIPLTVPALRDRREDIPLLANSFFRTLKLKSDKMVRGISGRAMELLMKHDWPGNVRELRSAFEYAFVTCREDTIQAEDLPASLSAKHGSIWAVSSCSCDVDNLGKQQESLENLHHPETVSGVPITGEKAFEKAGHQKQRLDDKYSIQRENNQKMPLTIEQKQQKEALLTALDATGGNQQQAARIIGVSRVTVWNRMKKFGISAEKKIRTM